MTRRTRGIALQQLIEDLTPYLIGWRGYFGFCQTPPIAVLHCNPADATQSPPIQEEGEA